MGGFISQSGAWAGALSLAFLLCCSSCSVKEDRYGCPCKVTVMSDGQIHDGHEGDVLVSVFLNKESLLTFSREKVPLDIFKDGSYSVTVPKGWFRTSGIGGTVRDMKFVNDTLLLIPPGCQCDAVCAFCADSFTDEGDDVFLVRGPLNKQFCRLSLRLSDPLGGDVPFSMRLKGNVDGFNIITMEPHRGQFSYDLEPDLDGISRVLLPRQSDSSLTLELWSGASPGEGRETDRIGIGRMIEASGYSWNAISLEDIDITVDYAHSTFTVFVNGWETGKSFNFEI